MTNGKYLLFVIFFGLFLITDSISVVYGGCLNQTGVYNKLINVKDPPYLAAGDGITDDTNAIQAGLNAACAAANATYSQIPAVYLPDGVYRTTFPLIIDCQYAIRLFGQGKDKSVIFSDHSAVWAPTILVHAAGYATSMGTRTGTNLATGSGNSLNWDSGQDYFYALRDSTQGNNATNIWQNSQPLNGLTAMSVEFFFNFTGSSARTYYIMDSAQTDGFHTVANAQQLDIDFAYTSGSTGTLRGCLLLSTGGETCASGTVNTNTTYEAELSYDGSNVRLFAGTPGATTTLLQTTAGTGTVVQVPASSFFLGAYAGTPFDGGDNGTVDPWQGQLDSIRISKVARHTTTYTAPTAKFTSDGNTGMLINGTNFTDALLEVDFMFGGGVPGYIPAYNLSSFATGQANNGLMIDNLTVSHGTYGIEVLNELFGTIKDVNITGASVWGLKLWNNSYGWLIQNAYITSATYSVAGIGLLQQTGLDHFTDIQLAGGYYGIASTTAGGQFDSIYDLVPGTALADIVLSGTNSDNPITLHNLSLDVESGGSAIPLLLGQGSFVIDNANLQTNAITCTIPAIALIGHTGGITLNQINVSICTTAPEIVNINGQTIDTPVTFIGGSINGASLPQYSAVPLADNYARIYVAGYLLKSTVAGLPTCNATNLGQSFGISDCGTCTTNSSCVHSGSPVTLCSEYCDGSSAWIH